MSDMAERIIDLIIRNRISTVQAADAMDKTGVIEGLHALNSGHFTAGRVHYVCTYDESNWPLHEQIQDLPENTILYVDAINCKGRAVFGDIVSKYLLLYKRMKALVVNGTLRDAHRLRKENYPIWLKGVTPKGCFNKHISPAPEIEEQIHAQKALFQNSLMICDDSGVTLIGPDRISKETYSSLKFIELQEDIWYYCTDTLKWNTYDTICLKNYLKNPEILPFDIRNKLQEYVDLKS